MIQDARVYSMRVEQIDQIMDALLDLDLIEEPLLYNRGDRADYTRAKLDHNLIV